MGRSQDQILDLICNFVDQIIPGKPFTLAGLSWGGELSLGIVNRRTEMIEGLFLSVPAVNVGRLNRNLPKHVTLVEDPSFIGELQEDKAWITDYIVEQDLSFLDRLRKEIFQVDRENEKLATDWDLIRTKLAFDPRLIYLDKPIGTLVI